MQAGFLFELAVKATLVIGATWALVRIMSRASAATRSSAWTWGLMFILALPPCIALLPAWSAEALSFSPSDAPSARSSQTSGRWEFKPGLWLGEPVPVLITVDMRFTLR
jgi:hypothetical protein